MKKALIIILCGLLLTGLCSCTSVQREDGRISIVTVMFPEYDFSKNIAGDRADVTMLLPPGGESHTYDPTPGDIISINKADVFIYTGGESDNWIDTVLESSENEDTVIIRLMDICELKQEEIAEGMQEEKGEDEDETEYDEHVWTSPKNAVLICEEIARVLSSLDPKNSGAYEENLLKYTDKIRNLDEGFREISEKVTDKTLVFADRFPFRYFTDEYGFSYFAAFPGCSSEAEPAAKTVKFLIDKVKAENIPVVFTVEFSDKKIAYAIQDETGAEILELHSCHNVTREDFKRGVTYAELMEKNLENLREALLR